MRTKITLTLIAVSFLLMGCAGSGHYPITGQTVGIDDQVKFMSAPTVARY